MKIGLRSVRLPKRAIDSFYHGFSNRTLWPLLHNAIERPVFERSWWDSYRDVNQRFAEVVIDTLDKSGEALLWIHDYHLMLVPGLVRAERPDQRIGFFLHVPWPSLDIYPRLPWRNEILHGLLGADIVSFHTERYRKNFERACGRLLGRDGVTVRGSDVVLAEGRAVRTTASPISIDARRLAHAATLPSVDVGVNELNAQFAGRRVLLGVDRLDYTKGIVERLLAFELLLERNPQLRRKLALVQIAVPSRDDVVEYRQLRESVERLVGRINGRFTVPGDDVPVHYLYRSLRPEQLSPYYAIADVMLVTPLIDGMNLVAKEFVVVQQARKASGCLVLSEFTGAANELKAAVPCNPFDVAGLSRQLEVALNLPDDQRRRAIKSMANRVHHHDVNHWLGQQLDAIAGRGGVERSGSELHRP